MTSQGILNHLIFVTFERNKMNWRCNIVDMASLSITLEISQLHYTLLLPNYMSHFYQLICTLPLILCWYFSCLYYLVLILSIIRLFNLSCITVVKSSRSVDLATRWYSLSCRVVLQVVLYVNIFKTSNIFNSIHQVSRWQIAVGARA